MVDLSNALDISSRLVPVCAWPHLHLLRSLATELLKDGDLSAAFSRLLLDMILQEPLAP